MTDNEIIKALECCGNIVDSTCKKCVYHETYNASCVVRLMRDALDLIKRLQERIKKLENIERFATKTIEKQEKEIEKLNVELVGMRGACESYRIHYDVAQAEIERLRKEHRLNLLTQLPIARKIKAEAIKEFAEELSLDIQRHLMPNVGDDGTVSVENAERYFLSRIKKMMEGSK